MTETATRTRARKTTPRDDRITTAEQRGLTPDSLVGSFFHGTSEQGWQGCVVAEVSPGVYLVELFSWIMGESTDQQLVRLEDMFGWRFYDDAKWMNNAYNHGGVSQRWDRERKDAGMAAMSYTRDDDAHSNSGDLQRKALP